MLNNIVAFILRQRIPWILMQATAKANGEGAGANVDGGITTRRVFVRFSCLNKLLCPSWHMAVCFADHESASSAERQGIGKR